MSSICNALSDSSAGAGCVPGGKKVLVSVNSHRALYRRDGGLAGHITVRDQELTNHFWMNPIGRSFKRVRVAGLMLCSHKGKVVEGKGLQRLYDVITAEQPDVLR